MEERYEKSIFDDEPIEVVYGGFWRRLCALILDWLVLVVAVDIITYFLPESWKRLFSPVVQVLVIAYKPLLEYLYGATPGKKALAIVVVNSAYGKINVIEAGLRNIFGIAVGIVSMIVPYTLSSFLLNTSNGSINTADIMSGAMIAGIYGLGIFFLYLADTICLVANNKKQSLHDLIAKTYVIRKLS